MFMLFFFKNKNFLLYTTLRASIILFWTETTRCIYPKKNYNNTVQRFLFCPFTQIDTLNHVQL